MSVCLLNIDPPYSLSLTVQVLRRVSTNIVDQWDGSKYRRALRVGSDEYIVCVRQRDETTLQVDANRPPEPVIPLLRRTLGVDVDLSEALRRGAAESWLASMIEQLRGLHPPRFPNLFETLCMTIPFQQVSLQAGQSFVNRLVESFGESRGCAWLFPMPRTIANATLDKLQASGLSKAKARTLQNAASLIADGVLSDAEIENLSSAEALRRLDDLPGIGPWTAAVILLRGFGRLDVFPPGDVGARRTLGRLLGRSTPLSGQEEMALLDRLGRYRGLLYFLGLAWSRGMVSAG
jgi:DNA-3-methyladenine glycosylase II